MLKHQNEGLSGHGLSHCFHVGLKLALHGLDGCLCRRSGHRHHHMDIQHIGIALGILRMPEEIGDLLVDARRRLSRVSSAGLVGKGKIEKARY